MALHQCKQLIRSIFRQPQLHPNVDTRTFSIIIRVIDLRFRTYNMDTYHALYVAS